MHRFTDLLQRFGRDERGVFAVVFGVMAVVLIALGGAVVDYVRLEQTRNRAQVALDAAALALQPEIFKKPLNEADIKAKAHAFVMDRVGSEGLGGDEITSSVEIARADVSNGSLYLEGKINVPTAFVRLVGVNDLAATFFAEATRKMLNLEVAMVLDNSGSMQQHKRMTYLKIAATCATNILFYDEAVDEETCEPLVGAASSDKVKIGIVPFTTMVNVGTQFANASWLDWSGQSSIAKLNFDNDDNDGNGFSGLVDRKALFTKTNTAWRGCVEARLAPNDTTDAPAVNSNAKFVPFFVPDGSFDTRSSYISDIGGSCAIDNCTKTVEYGWGGSTVNHKRQIGNVTTNFGAASCIGSDWTLASRSSSWSGYTEVYSPLSRRELQERLCKYDGTNPGSSATNASCPTVSLLPLSGSSTTVKSKIAAMTANGGTNIQQGTVWGFHALTPSEPLTEGLINNNASVKKVLIIMTDGFNEPDFRSYYGDWNGNEYSAWGYRKDGRLADGDGMLNNANEYNAFNSKADMTAAMDQKTLDTCINAKNAGIEVFTIGLSSPSQATTDMLTACSSGKGYHHFPTDPSQLAGVFKNIAAQLAQLRLAQ